MLFEYILIFLAVINILSVIFCLLDKYYAVNNKWRIPEKTLFLLSLLGGAMGMYVTMCLIRHKTRHKRFMIGLPLIIIAQIVLITIVIFKVL